MLRIVYIYVYILYNSYDPEDRAHPQEDRGTPKGGAFWGRSTEEKRLGPAPGWRNAPGKWWENGWEMVETAQIFFFRLGTFSVQRLCDLLWLGVAVWVDPLGVHHQIMADIIGRSTTRVKWPMIQSHKRYVDPSQEPLSHENQKVSHLPRDHSLRKTPIIICPIYHLWFYIIPVRPHWPIEPPRSPSCFARWGEFASGEAGRFDKDDLVQAVYPGSQEVYCAQVVWGGPVGGFFWGTNATPKKRGWGLLGIMMQLGNAIFGYDILIISVSWVSE